VEHSSAAGARYAAVRLATRKLSLIQFPVFRVRWPCDQKWKYLSALVIVLLLQNISNYSKDFGHFSIECQLGISHYLGQNANYSRKVDSSKIDFTPYSFSPNPDGFYFDLETCLAWPCIRLRPWGLRNFGIALTTLCCPHSRHFIGRTDSKIAVSTGSFREFFSNKCSVTQYWRKKFS
jgi:hypothetical protein